MRLNQNLASAHPLSSKNGCDLQRRKGPAARTQKANALKSVFVYFYFQKETCGSGCTNVVQTLNKVETPVGRGAPETKDTDQHHIIPMIVASVTAVSPTVYICGQRGDTFVRAYGIRFWRRRTNAVGAIRFAVTRETTQRQVVQAPNRVSCSATVLPFVLATNPHRQSLHGGYWRTNTFFAPRTQLPEIELALSANTRSKISQGIHLRQEWSRGRSRADTPPLCQRGTDAGAIDDANRGRGRIRRV